MPAFGPPQLGSDDIVRFVNAEHFLEEYAQNLRLGRLFVRTKRSFQPRDRLMVAIEGPGVDWTVGADAVVLLSKAGYVGLELRAFEEQVLPTLELLADEVKAAGRAPPRRTAPRADKTLIGGIPGPEEGTRVEANPLLGRPDSLPPSAEDTADPLMEVRPRASLPSPTAPSIAAQQTDFGRLHREVPSLPPARAERSDSDGFGDDPGERSSWIDRSPVYQGDFVDQNTMPLPAIGLGRAGIPSEPAPPRSVLPPIDPPSFDPDGDEYEDEDESQDLPMPPPPARIPPPAVSKPALAPPPKAAIPSNPSSVQPIPRIQAPAEPPAPEPPAAPPGVEAVGLEALELLRLPRATTGGVVRVIDLGDLAGWYLSSMRHGSMSFFGGPSGAIGDEVSLKIAAGRVITLPVTIAARIGPWVTVSFGDVSEIEDLLSESAEEWRSPLERIVPEPAAEAPNLTAPNLAAPAVPSIAPPPSLAAPSLAAPSLAAPSLAAPSLAAPSLAAPSLPAPPSLPAASISEAPAPTFDEPGPPQAARLEGDFLIFRGPKDLQHEVDSNLRNGGLFAASPPLAIRQHKSLKVVVGSIETPLRIEADVVFAAGGKVGFAVTSFHDAVAAIDKMIKQGITARDPATPTQAPPARDSGAPGASMPAPGISSMLPGPELPTSLGGTLARPFGAMELMGLADKLLEPSPDLQSATVLLLFDMLTRHRMRGVLTLKKKDEQRTLYLHEGSVAFVEARPILEEQCLGRILISQKKLTEGALREALERARATRRPLGRTLVATGSVTAQHLISALREQTRVRVEPTFEWAQGSFEWSPWQEPPTKADLVLSSGQGLIVKYLRHLYEQATTPDVEALIAPNATRVLIPGDADAQSPMFGFQPKELRFLEGWVDGKRTIGDAVTGSPIGRLASLRLIAFSLSAGILRFKDGQRAAGKSAAPRRSTDGRGHGALKKSLEEDLRLMRDQNYFELLGVHWSAHHRQYATAYAKAKARFDPNKGELKDAPPPILKLAKEACDMIDSAYKKLTEVEERNRYRKSLHDQTEREYAADMLVKQAEVMMLRGDRIGCIEAFETAVELAPTARNRSLLAAAREGRPL